MGRLGNVRIVKRGKVVSSSRNLRGLMEYHRKKAPVVKSSVGRKDKEGGAIVKVKFADQAHCETEFASHRIAKDWIKSRRKRCGWE